MATSTTHHVEHFPVLDYLKGGGKLLPPVLAQMVIRHHQATQVPQHHYLPVVRKALELPTRDPLWRCDAQQAGGFIISASRNLFSGHEALHTRLPLRWMQGCEGPTGGLCEKESLACKGENDTRNLCLKHGIPRVRLVLLRGPMYTSQKRHQRSPGASLVKADFDARRRPHVREGQAQLHIRGSGPQRKQTKLP